VQDQIKQALDQVKAGAGDAANTILKQAKTKLDGLKDIVQKAGSKVSEAGTETAGAKGDLAKDCLSTAGGGAAQGTEGAVEATKPAADALAAVTAAVLDAINTIPDADGTPLSGGVKKLKGTMLAAAEVAINIGKAGLTLAQTAVKAGQMAIDACASRAV